jgi:DNA helicase-2/ATP-dependent DNA helicase PcrA
LAITFTNKAAAELRGRIEGTIGEELAARLTAATFHSFCLSVLREHAAEASLPPDFVVLDEEEKLAFLKLAVGPSEGRAGAGDAQMDSTHAVPMQARPQKIRRLASYIEERKRFLLLPGDRVPRLGPGAPGGLAELATELGVPPLDVDLDVAYARYRDELKRAHALDFDDLVAGAARLLAARPEILSAYRARFRAIFVDEYQDVNFAQYALLRLLAPGTPAAPGTLGPTRDKLHRTLRHRRPEPSHLTGSAARTGASSSASSRTTLAPPSSPGPELSLRTGYHRRRRSPRGGRTRRVRHRRRALALRVSD